MTNYLSGLKLLLFVVCIFAGQSAASQSWKWVNPVSSPGIERGYDVAVDSAGERVTVVGSWDGTDLSAQLGSDFAAGGGGLDGLVAQYDLNGTLIWAFALANAGDNEVLAVEVDEVGDIYIAGYFTNSLNFQGVGGRSEILVNPSGSNAFLAKYDTLGNLMWTVNNGAIGDARGLGVVVDTLGAYTTGTYAGALNFVSAATAPLFTLIPGIAGAPVGSMFTAHYDTSGTLVWVADGGLIGTDAGRDLALNANTLYVTGNYQSALFDIWDGTRPGAPSASLVNSGGDDAFFMALDRTTGTLKWATSIICVDDDFGNAIGVWNDRVLVHGSMGISPLAIFPNGVTPTVSGTRNLQDAYVTALDTGTGNTVWARIEAGAGDDFGQDLSIVPGGDFLVTGGFLTDINFSGTVLTATGQRDLYVAKYESATGNLLYAKQPPMADHDQGLGIAAYSDERAFVTGEFRSVALFPPQLPTTHPSNDNLFLAECREGVVAVDDSICTLFETPSIVLPFDNDFGPFPHTHVGTIVVGPTNGAAIFIGTDSISYTPNTGFTGLDSIAYRVCDSLNSCDTAWVFFPVIPVPTVTYTGLAAGYCPGSPADVLTASPTGGVFAGPGISGSTFSSQMAGPGVHIVSYTFTTTEGCIAVDSQAVTVGDTVPTSIVNLDIFHCINDSPAVLVGNPAGGTFTGPGVGGGVFDPVGAGIGGPYNVKYTFTDTIGCSYSDSLWLFVLPLPSVTLSGLGSQYCSSDPSILLTGTPGGGMFSGSGMVGGTFEPGRAGPGTHDIVYSWADVNGCIGYDTVAVTVVEPPTSFTGLSPVACIDGAPDTLVGSPAGGGFFGPGVNGSLFYPDSAGLGIHLIIYEITDTAGCVGRDTQFVEVFDLPTPTFSTLPSMTCVSATAITLNAQPGGGNYAGPGVSGNIFDPSLAGIGTHTLIYTLTNANGCTGADTVTIQVAAALTVTLSGLNPTYCGGDAAVNLTGSPTGGVFSGPGISGTQFDPFIAGAGVHTISYVVTSGGCTDSTSQLVAVNAAPEVTVAILAPFYCESDAEVDLNPNPPGGTFVGPVTTSNTFDPAQAGVGNHTVTYLFTDTNGCTDSASTFTEVSELPFPINAGPDQNLFIGTGTELAADPPTVGQGSWSVMQGNGIFSDQGSPTSTFSDIAEGTNILVWSVENGACQLSDEMNITLFDFPEERGVSPNNDGVNDVLILPGIKSFPGTAVRIYTRWGSLVWESENYDDDWGGTNQAGTALPDDTYFYTIELPEGQQYKGFIFLKR